MKKRKKPDLYTKNFFVVKRHLVVSQENCFYLYEETKKQNKQKHKYQLEEVTTITTLLVF